jgi:hypothetical protein
MRPDAPVGTHADLGRINEADPTTLPKAADQKTAQGHQHTGQPLNKPVKVLYADDLIAFHGNLHLCHCLLVR